MLNILWVGFCLRFSWTWKALAFRSLCSGRNPVVIILRMHTRAGVAPSLACMVGLGATHHPSRLPSWLLAHCQLAHEPWISISELCGAEQATTHSNSQGTDCPSTLWLDSPSHPANSGFQPNLVAQVKFGWNFSLHKSKSFTFCNKGLIYFLGMGCLFPWKEFFFL